MEQQFVWETVDGVGTEHLSVEFDDPIRGNGIIVGIADDGEDVEEPFRIRYRVRCDASWTVRRVEIGTLGTEVGIEIEHDGGGNWTENGELAPEFGGCYDVDIAVTPFTNTIPIRRLDLDSDESAVIRVVYIDVPAMTAGSVEQRYTCLEPLNSNGGLFRYEGLDSGFTAELPIDSDGVVLDYPGLFRRVYP